MKISQLPPAAPLVGNEHLEIIQRGPEGAWDNHRLPLQAILRELAKTHLKLVTVNLPLVGDRAELPTPPLGDFVHDLALVALNDGSVVEFTELTHVVEGERHFVRLQDEDLRTVPQAVVSLTVSYMTLV